METFSEQRASRFMNCESIFCCQDKGTSALAIYDFEIPLISNLSESLKRNLYK